MVDQLLVSYGRRGLDYPDLGPGAQVVSDDDGTFRYRSRCRRLLVGGAHVPK